MHIRLPGQSVFPVCFPSELPCYRNDKNNGPYEMLGSKLFCFTLRTKMQIFTKLRGQFVIFTKLRGLIVIFQKSISLMFSCLFKWLFAKFGLIVNVCMWFLVFDFFP